MRTIPAMIRDQSAKKPAKGAPKKAAPKSEKAAPENKKAAPKKIAKALAGTKSAIIVAPSFRRERALIKRGVWPVAGCDEAGRGPLAGPVVAAAVILDPDRIPRGIDDSKRLTAEERERLFGKICATAQVSVAVASRSRIDRDNILRASLWALKRAVVALPQQPRHVFVDGRPARHGMRLRGRDRRRRHRPVDRSGLDHRQGNAGPPDVRVGAGLSRLRFRAA